MSAPDPSRPDSRRARAPSPDGADARRDAGHRIGAVAAATAGVVSAATGLALAEVAAGLSSIWRSPVLDVGDRVVDRVPGALKDLAISLFGTNDKVALLVGIGIALAAWAAGVGIVALRHSMGVGLAGIALFGVLGSLASMGARSGAQWSSPLPSIVGTLAAASALLLYRLVPTTTPAGEPDDAGAAVPTTATPGTASAPVRMTQRRRFLASSGALVGASVVLAVTGRRLQSRFSAAASRSELQLPPPAKPAAPVPAGASAEGAAPLFTPNRDFYRIDTALSVPQVDLESWTLRVTGMVDRGLSLTFDDLLRREVVEHDITLSCVSNTIGGDLIGNARWLGVRLDDLLAEARIDADADQVVGRSVDGYTCGFPAGALDGRNALVAFGMNGEPLPLEHGFPARLIVPGVYGYASATKWLTEIELTRFADFDHYWVPRGYSVEAPIKLQSRIDTPRGLDQIDAGPFVVGGVAWAQTVGIDGVQVRIDEGDWMDAALAEELNDSTWRQWSLPWDATPGRHSLQVRAIDRNGAIQVAERSEPLPDGATGHHTVVVLVADA